MNSSKHTISSELKSVEILNDGRIQLSFPEIEIILSDEEIKTIKDQINYFYCRNDIINHFRKKDWKYDPSVINDNELLDDMTTDYQYNKQGDTCDEDIQAHKTEIIEDILLDYEDELEKYLL